MAFEPLDAIFRKIATEILQTYDSTIKKSIDYILVELDVIRRDIMSGVNQIQQLTSVAAEIQTDIQNIGEQVAAIGTQLTAEGNELTTLTTEIQQAISQLNAVTSNPVVAAAVTSLQAAHASLQGFGATLATNAASVTTFGNQIAAGAQSLQTALTPAPTLTATPTSLTLSLGASPNTGAVTLTDSIANPTFAVSSADPTVATATVAGDVITVAPVKEGQTTINYNDGTNGGSIAITVTA